MAVHTIGQDITNTIADKAIAQGELYPEELDAYLPTGSAVPPDGAGGVPMGYVDAGNDGVRCGDHSDNPGEGPDEDDIGAFYGGADEDDHDDVAMLRQPDGNEPTPEVPSEPTNVDDDYDGAIVDTIVVELLVQPNADPPVDREPALADLLEAAPISGYGNVSCLVGKWAGLSRVGHVTFWLAGKPQPQQSRAVLCALHGKCIVVKSRLRCTDEHALSW